MFYDLNIPRRNLQGDENEILDSVARASKYGYTVMAVTTNLDERIFGKLKKEKDQKKSHSAETKNAQTTVPPPLDLTSLSSKCGKVKLLNRINFKASECASIRKFFQLKEIKKYDLVSLEPENQDVLKSLPGTAGIDILSYDPENKCDLSFSRKLYNQFINQNIFFELIYGPGIVDSSARRNLILLSHVYKAVGKSKNVIVSSGAEVAHQIRSPHDVINFNMLFGLSEEQAKSSITKNCSKLILRARGRKSCKSVVEMLMSEKA